MKRKSPTGGVWTVYCFFFVRPVSIYGTTDYPNFRLCVTLCPLFLSICSLGQTLGSVPGHVSLLELVYVGMRQRKGVGYDRKDLALAATLAANFPFCLSRQSHSELPGHHPNQTQCLQYPLFSWSTSYHLIIDKTFRTFNPILTIQISVRALLNKPLIFQMKR